MTSTLAIRRLPSRKDLCFSDDNVRSLHSRLGSLLVGCLVGASIWPGSLQANTAPAEAHDVQLQQRCLQESDRIIQVYDGQQLAAEQQLTALLQSCAEVPHLLHNLGVIAAEHDRWDEAIRWFDRSLQLDLRAYDSLQALSSIHQYKAAVAYQRALRLHDTAPRKPRPTFQRSDLSNANVCCVARLQWPGTSSEITPQPASEDTSAPQTSRQALDFTLASWWRTVVEHDWEAHPSHYTTTTEAPREATRQWVQDYRIEKLTLPEWEHIPATIELLPPLAVVTFRVPLPNLAQHTEESAGVLPLIQLILRLENERWLILSEHIWNDSGNPR